jgi:hypothetical protein
LSYQVGVISQPSQLSQVCIPSNATGVINGADVTNVVITCATSSFPVRTNISGLEGSGLRLQLQATGDPALPAQTVEVSEDGEVAFPTAVLDGTRFELSIAQQPTSQWCIVDHELPLQHSPNAAPWSIECTSDTYRVGGTVFGLRGTGLVLTNNGTDNLQISANGNFAFPVPLFDRTSYEVEVTAHPTNMRQTCSVTNARGGVAGDNVSHVFVNCTATQQLGSAGDDEAHATAVDVTANLYVAGRTNSTLSGAPSAGGWDGFLLKMDSVGDVQWWRQLGSPGDEVINSMTVSTSGEVYVTGSTGGVLDGANAGSDDLFVAKYNSAGDRLWIRQMGTSAADVAHAIDVGPDGDVYVTGATEGELIVGSAAGAADVFVVKLDANGNVKWMNQFGSARKDVAYGIDINAAGIVHIAGGTEGDFEGSANVIGGGEVGFITRINAQGVKLSSHVFCSLNCWFDKQPSWRQSRFNSIKIDASGDAYLGGWTRATEEEASGPEILGLSFTLLSKLNTLGGFAWVQRSNSGADDEITGIALAQSDAQLYSVSTRHSTPTLEALAAVKHTDVIMLTDIVWSPVNSRAGAQMRAIAADSQDNSYAVGFTGGSVDDQPNLGGSDIVIVRHNAAGEKL